MAFAGKLKFPLLVLGCLYGIFAAACFLAPCNYETQNRAVALAPPTHIHFVDQNVRFHLRPFVYRWKPRPGSAHEYEEDRTTAVPVYFFVAGWQCNIATIIPSELHLFDTYPKGNVFLLGTDEYGRDVFSRLLYGGQISLFAGLLAAALSVTLGLIAGALAGYYGRWIDQAVMRASELFLAIPWLYLLLTVRAFLPLHMDPVGVYMLLIGIAGAIGWARPARLVRGVVLSGRHREYILAAKGFGASDPYILRMHVFPQAYSVAMTQVRLYIPQYIMAEVTLSFFGLGVSEPVPSWGNMLARLENVFILESAWWMYSPAVLLVGVLLVFEWFFRSESSRF